MSVRLTISLYFCTNIPVPSKLLIIIFIKINLLDRNFLQAFNAFLDSQIRQSIIEVPCPHYYVKLPHKFEFLVPQLLAQQFLQMLKGSLSIFSSLSGVHAFRRQVASDKQHGNPKNLIVR